MGTAAKAYWDSQDLPGLVRTTHDQGLHVTNINLAYDTACARLQDRCRHHRIAGGPALAPMCDLPRMLVGSILTDVSAGLGGHVGPLAPLVARPTSPPPRPPPAPRPRPPPPAPPPKKSDKTRPRVPLGGLRGRTEES